MSLKKTETSTSNHQLTDEQRASLKQAVQDAEALLKATASASAEGVEGATARAQAGVKAAIERLGSPATSADDRFDYAILLAKQIFETGRRFHLCHFRSLEWLALWLFIAAGYILYVVVPKAGVSLFDTFMICLSLGTGYAMFRYESLSAAHYRALGDELSRLHKHLHGRQNEIE